MVNVGFYRLLLATSALLSSLAIDVGTGGGNTVLGAATGANSGGVNQVQVDAQGNVVQNGVLVRREGGASLFQASAADASGSLHANGAKSNSGDHCKSWPHEEPDLCPMGNQFWSKDDLRAALPAFAKVYKQRPIQANYNGMGVNHAFALWYTTHTLKPKYIIESGVYKGQSTWLMRQAAGPETHIFSLDPEPESMLTFRDDASNRTRYFLGEHFKDFNEMDWDSLIPWEDREKTLVMLDDHGSSIRRVQELLARGFRHTWYDDNWRIGADCYSFSWVCKSVPKGTISVPYKDHTGNKDITMSEQAANVQYMTQRMEVYFEFPALLNGCGDGSPALFTNVAELVALGLPSKEEDVYNYWTLHPPYVKLQAPTAVDNMLAAANRIGYAVPGKAGWTYGLVGWANWALR